MKNTYILTVFTKFKLKPDIKYAFSGLLYITFILTLIAHIIITPVILSAQQESLENAQILQTPDEIKNIYNSLQAANSLNTGLKIEIIQSNSAAYHNDGTTLKISSALTAELLKISESDNDAMALFIAREIAYAENVRAGFEEFQLEYLSDRAGLIVANNAQFKVDGKTFYKVVSAIETSGGTSDSRDKIRTLKIGVSQYVTPSDLTRLMSNKMRRGVTIKKGIEPGRLNSFSGWQPVLKNAIGGAFSNVAVYYGLNVASNMLDGYPISQSMKNAVKTTFTPEYLLGGLAGSVAGGVIGSIAGSLIPVPGAGPIISAFVATAPAIFCANLGSEIGTNSILDYKRNKKISLKRIWDAMDVSYLAGHSIGMAAGMAIGSALIPIPIVGGFIGGVTGGFIGSKVSGAIANVYHKLTGKAKDKITESANNNLNLPWLKRIETAVSGAPPINGANILTNVNAGDNAELIEAKKYMNEYYQKYIKLLAKNPEDSPELQKALDDFNAASERVKQINKTNK